MKTSINIEKVSLFLTDIITEINDIACDFADDTISDDELIDRLCFLRNKILRDKPELLNEI